MSIKESSSEDDAAYNNHVMKLLSTKIVTIGDGADKCTRAGEDSEESFLENGHCNKVVNEGGPSGPPVNVLLKRLADADLAMSEALSAPNAYGGFQENLQASVKPDKTADGNLDSSKRLLLQSQGQKNAGTGLASAVDNIPIKMQCGTEQEASRQLFSGAVMDKTFSIAKQAIKSETVSESAVNPFAIQEICVDFVKSASARGSGTGPVGADNALIISLAAAAKPCSPLDEANGDSRQGMSCGILGKIKVGGVQIVLKDLENMVQKHGGFQVVEETKIWTTVAAGLGIDPSRCITSAASLRGIFQQYMLPCSGNAVTFLRTSENSAKVATSADCKLPCKQFPYLVTTERQDNLEVESRINGSDLQGMSAIDNNVDRQGAAPPFKSADRSIEWEEKERTSSANKVKRESEVRTGTNKPSSDNLSTKSEADSSVRRLEKETSAMKEETRAGRESSQKAGSTTGREETVVKKKVRKDGDMAGLVEEFSDRKLSREERKMRAIMRQFEALERKQRGPETPGSGEASPRRTVTDAEAELASQSRKRKEMLNDDVRERDKDRNGSDSSKKERDREKERKADKDSELVSQAKKRSVMQVKDQAKEVRESKEIQEIKDSITLSGSDTAKKPRTSSRPVSSKPAKSQSKQKGRNGEDRSSWARGPLAVLREYRKAARKTIPCLPRMGKTEDRTPGHGRKAQILENVANDIRAQNFALPTTVLIEPLPPLQDATRLNPDRRPLDKKMFPIMKRVLAQWIEESKSNVQANMDGHRAGDNLGPNPQFLPKCSADRSIGAGEQDDESGICEMEIDHSPPSSHSMNDGIVKATGIYGTDSFSGYQRPAASESISEEFCPAASRSDANDGSASRHTSSMQGDTETTGETCRLAEAGLDLGSVCKGLSRSSASTANGSTCTTSRPSPPLSPVSSEGVTSRNGSPLHRSGADSSAAAAACTPTHGAHKHVSSGSRVAIALASPRPRPTAWDVAPSSQPDRAERPDSASRDSRIAAARDGSLHRELLLHRDSSPGQVLRRRPPSPPRALFTGEIRERGLHATEGGLSRESLRREREGLTSSGAGTNGGISVVAASGSGGTMLARERERDRFFPIGGTGGSADVHSLRGSDRLISDLQPRSRSPGGRGIERAGGDRALFASERLALERSGIERSTGAGTAGASLTRERSLSPRSKEALREMQVARERRAKEGLGESVESGDLDAGSAGGRGWNGSGVSGVGLGRAGEKWWPPGSTVGRIGGLGTGGVLQLTRGGPSGSLRAAPSLGAGLVRRERPSMFDHRRGGR